MMIPDRCIQFEERMNDLLDRREELTGDQLLNRHAQECSNCARWLAAQTRISECFSELDNDDQVIAVGKKSSVWPGLPWIVAACIGFAILALNGPFLNVEHGTPVAQLATPPKEIDLIAEAADPVSVASNEELEALYAINSLATSLLFIEDLLPDEISQRIEQAADPIRPLTNSVSSTINVLRQTIPVGTKKKFEDPHTSSLPSKLLALTDFA